MLGKIFDRVLDEEEGAVEKLEEEIEEARHSIWRKRADLILASAIFFLALLVRLYSLFYITDPQNAGIEGWYSDTYHHWQIAYLSGEIGFKEGFLRLWDLKGMEFFWGLAHPLVGAVLIALTGSTSIVVFRIFSAVMGALVIVLVFLIVRRFWSWQAAVSAAFIGIFNPVGIFSDASGMVEPLGIAAALAGIYLFPKYAFLSGLLLAFSGMTRAEYWLLGGLVILGMLLIKTPPNAKPAVFVGYLIPMLVYMKYLLNYTGNAIYPLWWNFLGNVAGQWQADLPPSEQQLFVQKIYWLMAIVSAAGIGFTFWRRVKFAPLLLFGFGNWLILGVTIGMTSYLLSYLPRFWVDRIMIWPYQFGGVLASIFIFDTAPKILPKVLRLSFKVFGALILVFILVLSQFAWNLIHFYYEPTRANWEHFREIARKIGGVDPKEGRVLIPEDWPPLTYMLVYFEGIEGKRLRGQMFDPFFYMGDLEGVFANWGDNRKVVKEWLEKEDIRLLVLDSGRERYEALIKREPGWFEEVGGIANISFYKVTF